MNLTGPILITGAASGLGKACADYFSNTILLDKNLNCDITDENQLKNFIDNLPEIPRVLINCAGIIHAKKIEKINLEEYKNIININLIGTFNVIKLMSDRMKLLEPIGEDQERGVIINTASIAAEEGQVGQVAYSASKGGIVSMTLPLARELGEFGIRVVTISPGVIETPMISQVKDNIKQKLIADTVFPKRLGKPQEFAKLTQHIIENVYLNGCVIRLDAALRLT